ncbi:MAG: hypothetical protein Kow00124_23780 [Anaerolineae bacterium]
MADFPAIWIALVLLAGVAFYIAQPLLSRRSGRTRAEGRAAGPADTPRQQAARRRAELLAERLAIYQELRDLDFDYKTDKLAEDDYKAQRYQLVARGVEVLKQLDALDAHDAAPPPETAAEAPSQAAAAAGEPVAVAVGGAGHACPRCGAAVSPGDRFCGACGAPLVS